MAITIANITINRISSRGTVTRRGDGGAIERVLTLGGRTSKRFDTLAAAKAIEVQLHELVWYSRQAGGLYVNSSEFDVDDGLYILDSVDTSTSVDAQTTYIVDVDLSLIRIGGAGANVQRYVHILPSLQSNSWSVTSTPWYALPVGATNLGPTAGSLGRTSADGAVPVTQSSVSNRYAISGADYNAGECKVWDTAGSATPADWVRVYGPDHQFAQPYHCAVDNGLIRFVPLSAAPGTHDLYVYESSGSAWREVGTSTYVLINSTTGVVWQGVQITELTPWRVTIQYRSSFSASPYFAVQTLTLERGRPVALSDYTVPSATTMRQGIIGATNFRFALGHDTTNNVGDARDDDTESAAITFSDTDDNWIAVVGDTADHDVMGIVATRTATNTDLLAGDATAFAQQTSAATLAVYIGGIAYDTANIVSECEAGSLGGTAATATIASASGGTPNCVSLPSLTAAVTTLNAASPPALSGTANIIVRMYARIQNVGTSASDEAQIRVYNETAANYPANTTKTFSVLGSTGTWKWMSVQYTAWNGTDTLRAEVRRSVAGGGGSLYADLVVIATIDSGVDGVRAVARAALTENKVWPEHSRVSV
jgi:hypothetical protein